MEDIEEDKAREERIDFEIVVDAYDETERAMGWHCYLDDNLNFPFKARCKEERKISPLQPGETVEVYAMASEEDCQSEIFVMIRWNKRTLGIPLAQLEAVDADEITVQSVEDWHYWVKRGYEF